MATIKPYSEQYLIKYVKEKNKKIISTKFGKKLLIKYHYLIDKNKIYSDSNFTWDILKGIIKNINYKNYFITWEEFDVLKENKEFVKSLDLYEFITLTDKPDIISHVMKYEFFHLFNQKFMNNYSESFLNHCMNRYELTESMKYFDLEELIMHEIYNNKNNNIFINGELHGFVIPENIADKIPKKYIIADSFKNLPKTYKYLELFIEKSKIFINSIDVFENNINFYNIEDICKVYKNGLINKNQLSCYKINKIENKENIKFLLDLSINNLPTMVETFLSLLECIISNNYIRLNKLDEESIELINDSFNKIYNKISMEEFKNLYNDFLLKIINIFNFINNIEKILYKNLFKDFLFEQIAPNIKSYIYLNIEEDEFDIILNKAENRKLEFIDNYVNNFGHNEFINKYIDKYLVLESYKCTQA